MKKMSAPIKFCGFSLAEALITLLIVCLITLASIPVLTKKRRTVSDGGSGQWICTLAAQKDGNGNITGYKHVYWNSQTSGGDINDPSTWEVAGDGTSCTFAPPLKAKNFGITLIGGGGGGGEGISDRKILLDLGNGESKILANPETGIYRLAVIGNGGGGSGSDDEDGTYNRGIGGQGGGGGYWMGEINLNSANTYKASVANTANTSYPHSDGGSNCAYGYDRDRGWTSFGFNNGINIVNAGSGQSGRSTKNKGGADPKCGEGGAGGTFNTNTDYHNILTTKYASVGKTGRTNTNFSWDNNSIFRGYHSSYSMVYGNQAMENGTYFGYTDTGVSIPKEFWGDTIYGAFGAGGYGAKAKQPTGYSGSAGRLVLWQITQKPGKGGEASPLETTVVANIKGKLVATIGQGGKSGEDGKQTKATIYDSQGKASRILSSQYGKKGTAGDPIAADAGYVNGETGKNSLWLDKGGGAPGQCKATEYKTVTVTKTGYLPSEECKAGFYYVGPVSTKSFQPNDKKITCPINGFYCLGYVYNSGVSGAEAGNYEMNYQNFEGFMQNQYNKLLDITASNEAVGSYMHSGDVVFSGSYYEKQSALNIDYFASKYGMQQGELVCNEYKPGTSYTYQETETQVIPPTCTAGGNGTYFGAGGGGGGSSNTLGLKGEGGIGAPGAVIIEW